MKISTFILIFILSFSSFSSERDHHEYIAPRLDYIIKNFKNVNVAFEVDELSAYVKENRIDLSSYGLGRGAFHIWKKETYNSIESRLEKSCSKKERRFNSELLSKFESINTNIYEIINPNLNLSVISKDLAESIFTILKDKSGIPFAYKKDGCYARAHYVAMILDEYCINSAKAYLLRDLNNNWSYHVANIVLVKDEDRIIPYIIDPSVESRAVPLDEWISSVKGYNYRSSTLHITSKYIYRKDDLKLKHNEYRLQDSFWMEVNLGLYNTLDVATGFPGNFIRFLKD